MALWGGFQPGPPDPFGFGTWYDPFWTPGLGPASRRRLSGPPEGGAAGEGTLQQQEGAAGGLRHHDPYVVGSAGWTRSIPVDVVGREGEYLIRADIPGVKKSEIHVDVHGGNVLRFGHNPNAEREKEDEEEMGMYLRAERVTTFRNRNLRMPEDADLEGEISAKYEDGVLSITVPKKAGTTFQEGKLVAVQ